MTAPAWRATGYPPQVRRAAQTIAFANSSYWGWGSNHLLTWFRHPNGGWLGAAADMEGGSVGGDSSGSVLINVDGEWAIAGVLHYSWIYDIANTYNSGGAFVRSAPLNGWILSYATDAIIVGTIVPEPASLGLLVAGAAMLMLYRSRCTGGGDPSGKL